MTIITGSSSGFGALAARSRARTDHTVYASMRETTGRNSPPVEEVEKYLKASSSLLKNAVLLQL